MPTVFEKLNYKGQPEVVVLNAPQSFEPQLAGLAASVLRRSLHEVQAVSFSLAFVIRQTEVDDAARALAQKAQGDAVLWFAYPKGTSKRYKCEFNRDTGWAVLGELGYEPVRQVAIDEDWSALRFRKAEFIKNMKRSAGMRISAAGKARASQE